LIREHELGQSGRAFQENHQRALREKALKKLDVRFDETMAAAEFKVQD
jgi:hypothetical protein